MNLRLDQLLIAMLFEPRLLGLYVVAVAWGGAIAPIINAVGPVLFPRLSKVADRTQQRILVSSVVRVTSLVILILTVLLLVLTPFMVPFLFGSAYRDAVPAAQILVVAGAFGNLNLTLEDGLRGLGRPRKVLTAEVIGMVVTAVLLWLLLPVLNILGAALASVVAYAAITLCLVYAIRRELIMN